MKRWLLVAAQILAIAIVFGVLLYLAMHLGVGQ